MILALLLAAAPCQPPAPDARVKVTFPPGATLDELDRFAVEVLCQPKGAAGKRPLTLTIDGTVYGRQLPALVRLLAESAGAAPAVGQEPAPVACPPLPAGSITPVDPWTRKITSAVRDALVDCAMTQVRVVPSYFDGTLVGFKLFAIRAGSIPEQLGLQNGDVVTSANGFPLTTPDQALEAYAKLKDAPELKLAVTRAGAPRTITWRAK